MKKTEADCIPAKMNFYIPVWLIAKLNALSTEVKFLTYGGVAQVSLSSPTFYVDLIVTDSNNSLTFLLPVPNVLPTKLVVIPVVPNAISFLI